MRRYDICLTLKTVKHKSYSDFQSLLVPTHRWKDLSIDFFIGLLISNNWKGDSYDFILIIVDQLTKMMYYELVKVTINTLELAKGILDIVVWHHRLLNLIMTNKGSFFTPKFWSSFCYFLGIK